MKTSENTILIDNYWGLISGLSRENKIQLFAKLSNAIAKGVDKKENVADKFFGAFKSNKSAEEIIEEIKK